eukprot:TRINITY_DN6101_c0_g2_i1.p1 TRINITY_DN6101_c0_g2~~TRINITY_DN6101_c0_g2_i1.p1  ORF type:complete len:407 (-),score=109.38 TRINITY_DN6101_c0_g2_i1:1171-2391(-)
MKFQLYLLSAFLFNFSHAQFICNNYKNSESCDGSTASDGICQWGIFGCSVGRPLPSPTMAPVTAPLLMCPPYVSEVSCIYDPCVIAEACFANAAAQCVVNNCLGEFTYLGSVLRMPCSAVFVDITTMKVVDCNVNEIVREADEEALQERLGTQTAEDEEEEEEDDADLLTKTVTGSDMFGLASEETETPAPAAAPAPSVGLPRDTPTPTPTPPAGPSVGLPTRTPATDTSLEEPIVEEQLLVASMPEPEPEVEVTGQPESDTPRKAQEEEEDEEEIIEPVPEEEDEEEEQAADDTPPLAAQATDKVPSEDDSEEDQRQEALKSADISSDADVDGEVQIQSEEEDEDPAPPPVEEQEEEEEVETPIPTAPNGLNPLAVGDLNSLDLTLPTLSIGNISVEGLSNLGGK